MLIGFFTHHRTTRKWPWEVSALMECSLTLEWLRLPSLSAPKDGTQVLLWHNYGEYKKGLFWIGHWVNLKSGEGNWNAQWYGYNPNHPGKPTHWKELSPPKLP